MSFHKYAEIKMVKELKGVGHFGGRVHSQSLHWYWETKQYRKIHKLNTTQNIATKLPYNKQNYPGSVASYDTQPGNETGLF